MILPFCWTPKIGGEKAINTIRRIKINNTTHSFLIRGENLDNPIVLVVHGGPACSEIPYVVKYQRGLEKYFTIVHYDQRGSGKSYHFKEDYSHLTVGQLIEDLAEIINYVCQEFGKEKIILMAHSFGTNIGMHTIQKYPQRIDKYIGIGQMVYTDESEKEIWKFCMDGATKNGDMKTCGYLNSILSEVDKGCIGIPRKYVRKYGGAARKINDNMDCGMGLLFRPEYSIGDIIRFIRGLSTAGTLFRTIDDYKVEEITKVRVPCYFLQGKYDYMTCTKQVEKYFNILQAPQKKLYIFEQSAHFPQFEEKQQFEEVLRKIADDYLQEDGGNIC